MKGKKLLFGNSFNLMRKSSNGFVFQSRKLRSPEKSSCAQTLRQKTSPSTVPHFLPNFHVPDPEIVLSYSIFLPIPAYGSWALYQSI